MYRNNVKQQLDADDDGEYLRQSADDMSRARAAGAQRRLNMIAIMKTEAVAIVSAGVPMYLGAELVGPGCTCSDDM